MSARITTRPVPDAKDPDDLGNIDEAARSPEVCLRFVEINPYNIYYVPPALLKRVEGNLDHNVTRILLYSHMVNAGSEAWFSVPEDIFEAVHAVCASK